MLSYYFDEMMSGKVAQPLREMEIEVVRAAEIDMLQKDDDTEHLPYAAAHSLVLVTQDYPFAGRASKRTNHAGLVCWAGSQFDYGGQIRALHDFAQKHTADDVKGRVFWLK